MSLSRDLLDQARLLATKEPRRPKQASLRRAVSAAYYSLFHLLISDSSRSLLGGSQQRQNARGVVSRCFEHAAMAQCCKAFDSGNLPARISSLSPFLPISSELGLFAHTFVELQEERHRADYDTLVPFQKGNVLRLIEKTTEATTVWAQIRKTDEATSFLLCLLFWKTLRDR